MPVRIGKIKYLDGNYTGASAFLHTCEICGEAAYFGFKASFRSALNQLVKGNIDKARELLGKWFCLEHKEHGEKL